VGAPLVDGCRQIKDPVENKGRKTYTLPSIVVLDVSRLGYAGQMPAGPWTAKFQDVLRRRAACWASAYTRRSGRQSEFAG
jgi:hypothetical protein